MRPALTALLADHIAALGIEITRFRASILRAGRGATTATAHLNQLAARIERRAVVRPLHETGHPHD